jgi:hypothetical protein
MKTRFVVFSFCLSALVSSAQNSIPNRCSLQENLTALKAADPSLESRMQGIEQDMQTWIAAHHDLKSSAPAIIPIVFHVVYNTAAQNVPDVIIHQQIEILNADYSKMNSDTGNVPAVWKSIAANTGIQFCLASRDTLGNPTTGIIHTQTTVSSFSTSPSDNKVKFASMGGANAWDRNSYLNVWVCNMGSGVLGYAQMPGGPAATDGVVINYWAVGRTGATAPYNLGRTTTHEIGHWFNLIHTWGDDYGACTGTDYVTDTPNEGDANYSNYAPGTVITDNCSTTAPGIMWQNYLDYTDDAGMCIFTAGQVARMQACLNGTRAAIFSSQACGPLAVDNHNISPQLTLYPSPSTGIINIKTEGISGKVNIQVYSITGEQVLACRKDLNAGENTLDFSSLPSGMYLTVFNLENNDRIMRKVILNH